MPDWDGVHEWCRVGLQEAAASSERRDMASVRWMTEAQGLVQVPPQDASARVRFASRRRVSPSPPLSAGSPAQPTPATRLFFSVVRFMAWLWTRTSTVFLTPH